MLYLIYLGLSFLPLSVLYLASRIGAFSLYHIFRYRRKVVRENLNNAFPDLTRKEISSIEKGFYTHLCRVAVEIVKAIRLPESDFVERVKIKNPGLIKEVSNN